MLHVNRSIFWGLYLMTLAGASLAADPSPAALPISNTLTAQRVVRVGGEEHLESAATGRPGDVIEYTVQFHNAGSAPAHALEATLPIPLGVALIPSSVRPAAVRASLDGSTFESLPLMHKLRHADGTTTDEPVPASQIRFLRWAPAELAANSSMSVSARVVLDGSGDASAAK